MSGERRDPEQVIRDWLADSAPDRAPASLRETLEDVTTRPAGNSRQPLGTRLPRLRLAGGIAAALAILAVVSSSVYIHATSQVAGPTAAESASPTTPVGPVATASHAEGQLVGDWHRVDTQWVDDQPGAFMGSHVTPVVGLSSGGFAAFVFDPVLDETVVYGSRDGTVWTNVGVLPTKNSTVTSVTDSGGKVVAAGYAYDNAANTAVAVAWVSSDLRTWHATVLAASTNAGVDMVVSGPGGFLAYGRVLTETALGNASPAPLFWASADGTTWRAVPGRGFPAVWPYYLSANSDVYVAITNIEGRIQSWSSVDGAVWTQSWTSPTDSVGRYSMGGHFLIAPDGSYLMFGSVTNFSTNAVKWTSTDLVHWTISPAQILPNGFPANSAASIPGGFVAASDCGQGQSATALCVFTSSNGSTWQQAPEISTQLGGWGLFSNGFIAEDGSHVVVVLWDNSDGIHFLVGTELGNR